MHSRYTAKTMLFPIMRRRRQVIYYRTVFS